MCGDSQICPLGKSCLSQLNMSGTHLTIFSLMIFIDMAPQCTHELMLVGCSQELRPRQETIAVGSPANMPHKRLIRSIGAGVIAQ